MTIYGKALLTIEKMDSDWIPFCVRAHIQSCSGGEYGRESALEEFGFLEAEQTPLPVNGDRMKVGDRITVSVVFQIIYCRDPYFGDCSSELLFTKVRVLRRRPA